MDYKVMVVSDNFASDAADQLDQQANEYICNGWKPLGGVSVSKSDDGYFQQAVLAQAIIKE